MEILILTKEFLLFRFQINFDSFHFSSFISLTSFYLSYYFIKPTFKLLNYCFCSDFKKIAFHLHFQIVYCFFHFFILLWSFSIISIFISVLLFTYLRYPSHQLPFINTFPFPFTLLPYFFLIILVSLRTITLISFIHHQFSLISYLKSTKRYRDSPYYFIFLCQFFQRNFRYLKNYLEKNRCFLG